MQSVQCDLHPCVAEHHGRTAYASNRAHPHRSRPFIAGCTNFTRKNTRFPAPASSPTQSPCNIHAVMHDNAFCSTARTFMQPSQCDLHPCVAEHHGRIDYASTRAHPHPHPPHTRAALPRRLQPLGTEKNLARKKTQGFVLRLNLPTTDPMQHSCNHYTAFCSTTPTFMQSLQCDLQLHIDCVMYCYVMYCCVMYCDVMYCCVMYC